MQDPEAPAVEVLCANASGSTLLLTSIAGPLPRTSSVTCQLQFSDASGIFQVSGTVVAEDTVRLNGVIHPALRFDVDLDSARHLNRRTSYRVDVTLKGELAVFKAGELGTPGDLGDRNDLAQGHLVELADLIRSRKRPCIIQDLSLGGARAVSHGPAPRRGQTALLDVALARGDVLRNIAGTVVQGRTSRDRPEFSSLVRLRFAPLPGHGESRLARLINQVQLQTLRHGVRDRR